MPPYPAEDLRVRRVRALRGPNLWRPGPVAAGEVETGGLPASPREVAGLAERLEAALPAAEACVQRDGRAGCPADVVRLGGGWAELVGAVAVELQSRYGTPVRFSAWEPAGANEAAQVVVEYEEEGLGVESLYEAGALLRRLLHGEDAEVERTLRRLFEVDQESRPGPTLTVMLQAARRRGIPFRRLPGEQVVQLGLGARQRRIDATMTDSTSVIATDLTSHKDRTKRVLARAGLPAPRGTTATAVEEALDAARDLGFPVLLKPLDANDGRGISGRLEDEADVRAAWEVAVAENPTVVVERFVEGRDHRVVVVDGRVVAVAERIPAHVVGDGRRTIRELAEEVNRDPARRLHHREARLMPLPMDALTEAYLARHGFSWASVPRAGEAVQLRGTANISTGGTAIDRTDEIHPRNRALCELAAGLVGLDVAGIDVLTPDISVPFPANGASIIEVNASPGILMHVHPNGGEPRDVPGAILDMLFPPGTEATIPVVAVTGTNGKTTTTRLIAHLLGLGGARVGYTTTDGVYYRGDLLLEGDLTGPLSAAVVLSHPGVDVAVLETARGGILRGGLGYDACDVGVVLNVTSDHLGMRGIDTVERLADVKAVIAGAVRPGGRTVLNADDPLVLAMRERTRGEVVLISTAGAEAGSSVARHLAVGGTAGVVEDEGGREAFVLRRGAERVVVATVEEVPLTLGGAARFQLWNVLAAVCAAEAMGMDAAAIRAGLLAFLPGENVTPGRMNVLRTARGPIVVDYAHNPAAVAALVDLARRMPGRRRIGVFTMPGDRRDEDLRELGRAAAGLDHVIVKEHPKYRRGRAEGETARIIAEGVREAGVPQEGIETVLPEPEAVARALEVMGEGDVLLIVADDTAAVLEQLRPLLVDG